MSYEAQGLNLAAYVCVHVGLRVSLTIVSIHIQVSQCCDGRAEPAVRLKPWEHPGRLEGKSTATQVHRHLEDVSFSFFSDVTNMYIRTDYCLLQQTHKVNATITSQLLS